MPAEFSFKIITLPYVSNFNLFMFTYSYFLSMKIIRGQDKNWSSFYLPTKCKVL